MPTCCAGSGTRACARRRRRWRSPASAAPASRRRHPRSPPSPRPTWAPGITPGRAPFADEAVAATSRRGTTVFEPQVQLTLARVLLRTDGVRARGAIEAALERAHTVAANIDARIHAPFIHLDRAELARLTADAAAHVRELREAHRLFAEMGATARAEQVARQLD